MRAQAATRDDGVSLGYFPLQNDSGWLPSYPETTGYIIPTLLRYAKIRGREDVRERALAMARWEVKIQMPSGAVQGGPVCPPEKQTPATFNTGMVLDGWSAAYRETGDASFLEAGKRAGRFLVDDLDERGYFRTNGAFVSSEEIKTYNCLCAWSMYRLGEDAHEQDFKAAAVKAIEAAIRLQNDKGWFSHCCLSNSKIPLTHTIGYTLQAILEVGLLAERADFVAAAEKGLAAVVKQRKPNGYLAGRLDDHWRSSALYACLTGSAQLAIVCFRLVEALNKPEFLVPGNDLINFVKAAQLLDSPNEAMNGAIAGSFPILGAYMKGGYPNWATKYAIDALMLQEQMSEDISPKALYEEPLVLVP